MGNNRSKPKVTILTVFWQNQVKDYFLRYYYSINRIIDTTSAYDVKVMLLNNSKPSALKSYISLNKLIVSKKYYIIEKEIEGFAKSNNYLFQLAKNTINPNYILLLNPDTELDVKSLNKLMQTINKSPHIFSVESRQYPFEHPKSYQLNTLSTPWSSGACLLVRANLFHKLGGFDELFRMYVEDVDLSWRALSKGWQIIYQPLAPCIHHSYGYTKNHYFRQYWGVRNNMLIRYKFGGGYKLFQGFIFSLKATIFYLKFLRIKEAVNVIKASLTGVIIAKIGIKKISLQNHANEYINFTGFDYDRIQK